MPHRQFLEDIQHKTNGLLDKLMPSSSTIPERLHQAMRYSALNPGKRLRPALVFATCEMLSTESDRACLPAVAVELIHAYSLIHDDLPCMDDDDLRRGLPTCHIQFDKATAVLAGDALQTLAFEILSQQNELAKKLQLNHWNVVTQTAISCEKQLQMIKTLSIASGSIGMGGGQATDLLMTDTKIDLQTLESMHQMKTGALIDASVKLGFLASDCEDQVILTHLNTYSRCLGLAFQIRDDILDIEGDTKTLGKPQGSDLEKNKSTFPALMGLDAAKDRADELVARALEALDRIPLNSDNLADFAQFIVARKH